MSEQIITIDYKSTTASKEFVESLHNTGFAVLRNHPLNPNLIDSVYNEWKSFFKGKDKYNYTFDIKDQDGYFPFQSENAKGYNYKDLKEFFHYYQWGRFPKNMSNNTQKIYTQLIDLGKILLNWIDMHSPIQIRNNYSMPLSEMIEDSAMNLMRIIHYPPLRSSDHKNAIRAAEHEDINLITLLSPGSEPGLQVLNKTNQWIDIKSNPEWLVINTGDMLKECSNEYFPSTTHRVINPDLINSNKSRYTIPLFVHPRDNVKLSKRYTARKFLDERLGEIGLK